MIDYLLFIFQGQAIDQHAKKSVKILVVGNPANTNALICAKYAPSIPRENFSAMTRLDQNRAAVSTVHFFKNFNENSLRGSVQQNIF